jgi:DNA-binding beta-propeller fold protein YncE
MVSKQVFALLTVTLLCGSFVYAQQPPQATELPSSPFFIKNTWMVGGVGDWDYLTLDAQAQRLYIAHDTQVQVVDVETGALAGEIKGFHGARFIALDPGGEVGYVSDGPANQVKVFDRRTFQILAEIATGPSPRAMAFDQQSGLLFVVCTNPMTDAEERALEPAPQSQSGPGGHASTQNQRARATLRQNAPSREIRTSISVIDPVARRRVGEILMPGKLGFAAADGDGQLFVLIVDRNQIARLDASAVAELLHVRPATASTSSAASASGADAKPQPAAKSAPVILDWSHESRPTEASQTAMRLFALSSACKEPRSLAVDGAHQRLFAACDNMKLSVLNAGTGETITSLPIGPGTDGVAYDAARGMIYAASGGAQGSLIIIHQNVTDTYAEIQNLPTRQRARTVAVNPDTGQVYLVTDYLGVNVAKPGGIGTLRSEPVEGSFQVLVIGN